MNYSSEDSKELWMKWCKFFFAMFFVLVVYIFQLCYANPTLDIFTELYIGWAALGVMALYYIVIYWCQVNNVMNSSSDDL